MKRSTNLNLAILCVFVIVLIACNLPFLQKTPTSTEQPSQTVAIATSTTGAETATPQEVALPTVTAGVVATNTPEPITHTAIPGDSAYLADQVVVDCNTGANPSFVSGCDYWNREWLERPFDKQNGTYEPALDILWGQAGSSGPWIFLKIKVYDLNSQPAEYKIGFELDADLDSRGEFLLLANKPISNDWTTDGVQIWKDTNGDVGGLKPFSYDQQGGDGYETKVFDSGVGNDSDLAWVRVSTKNPNVVEFAFKASLLPNPKVFGWWGWTGLAQVSPEKFEVVDSEDTNTGWNMDNTCGWIFGEKPKKDQLANLCIIAEPTATPTSIPVPTLVSSCPVQPCRIGLFWDQSTCSCKRLILVIPTVTPVIIR